MRGGSVEGFSTEDLTLTYSLQQQQQQNNLLVARVNIYRLISEISHRRKMPGSQVDASRMSRSGHEDGQMPFTSFLREPPDPE